MNTKPREFAPKGAWRMLSAHGNDDVIQMARPRPVRSGGSEQLKAAARAKGIFMVDGLGPEGITEEGAMKLIGNIPPIIKKAT